MAADDFNSGFALAIGTPFNPSTGANDAQAICDVLIDDTLCGYPENQVIRVLPDAATRDTIRAGLDTLVKTTDADSTVIIFFSGHGELAANGEFYIQPKDGDLLNPVDTCISGTELADRVANIPARKIVVILDCCHAGAADLADESLQIATAALKALPPDVAAGLGGLGAGFGRVVLAASQPGEHSSADNPLSVFTKAVVRALRGEGTSSTDGFVHLSDVIRFACYRVSIESGGIQNPMFISSGATDFRVARYTGPPPPFDPTKLGAQLATREQEPLIEAPDPANAPPPVR